MVAIVIINYKKEDLTISFIQKEIAKLSGKHKIFVVNNEATPETNKILSLRLNAPIVDINSSSGQIGDCTIISSKQNLGFAKGNNAAAKFILNNLDVEFILFTNNDIEIVQDSIIQDLIDKLVEHPEVGMIGPKVRGLDGKLQSPEPYICFWDRYVWMYLSTIFVSKEKKIKRFKLDYSQTASEGYHYKVMGSFFLVRAQDFINCGMMDPNTFLYAEEVILSERLKAINKKVYYYPKVEVIHAHGATTKNTIGKNKINKFMLQSESYYYSKYIHEPKWKICLGKCIYKLIQKL